MTHDWAAGGHETMACQVEGCGLSPLGDRAAFYAVHAGPFTDMTRTREEKLAQLCLELTYEYHSANTSIRDHVDRTAKGWTVGHITTCDDPLCLEAVELLNIKEEDMAAKQSSLDKRVEQQKKDQAEQGRAQSVASGQSYDEVDEVPISKDAIEQDKIQSERQG